MDQISALISGLSLKQRISIVAAALAVVAGVIFFVHWKHEGDFRPLYTSMAPEDAAGVVQKLRETGVEYRLSDNGGSVMVPSAKLAESRLALAAAGLPKTGRIGFELFDKSNFGATEFVEHINYKRALEGELERSVMSLARGGTGARPPHASQGIRISRPAGAGQGQRDGETAAGRADLRPERPGGHQPGGQRRRRADSRCASRWWIWTATLLSRPKKIAAGDGSEITSESLEVRQQIEKNLVAKISETLEPLLGANGFRAGASVDCDLTSGEQQEETLDPAHSVMLSSQKTEDVTERATTSGIPGTASNLPQQASSSGKGTATAVSRRTENVTYQTSRIVRHTKIPQGVIRRMSLAVLVDQSRAVGRQGSRAAPGPGAALAGDSQDHQATWWPASPGSTRERGDQLIVETLPFESSLNAEPPQIVKPVSTPGRPRLPRGWSSPTSIATCGRPSRLGLALLLVLVRGIFRYAAAQAPAKRSPASGRTGRPRRPYRAQPGGRGTSPPAHRGSPSAEDNGELAERVRLVAKREPELTVNVLAYVAPGKQDATESKT